MADRAERLAQLSTAPRTAQSASPQTFTVSSADQIARLRMLLAEQIPAGGSDSDTLFLNAELDDLLINFPTFNMTVAVGWAAKAAKLSGLVDIEESGSKRRLQQKFMNAQRMADFYSKQAGLDQEAIAKAIRVVGIAASPYATVSHPVTIESIVEMQAGGVWISYEPAAAGLTPIGAEEADEEFDQVTHGITIEIEKNRTFRMTIDVPSDGAFVDGHMQIKAVASDVVPVWDGTVASGAIGIEGGSVTVWIPPADTATLNIARGVFEVVGTLDTGDVVSLASGYVNVSVGVIT